MVYGELSIQLHNVHVKCRAICFGPVRSVDYGPEM